MATPQFNRKEVVKELIEDIDDVYTLLSFAEKTDKEIYELYKKLKQ